jgi:hypothetical protein
MASESPSTIIARFAMSACRDYYPAVERAPDSREAPATRVKAGDDTARSTLNFYRQRTRIPARSRHVPAFGRRYANVSRGRLFGIAGR